MPTDRANTPHTWERWPAVWRACISTFFSPEKFGRPGEVPANANYMLAGLLRFELSWNGIHGHRQVPHSILDAAAAHEIYYQYNRAIKPHRPAAWLSACIGNLVTDRPEYIIERFDRKVARSRAKTA